MQDIRITLAILLFVGIIGIAKIASLIVDYMRRKPIGVAVSNKEKIDDIQRMVQYVPGNLQDGSYLII
ncbi:13047_t:CDS:2 [Racocetra persica]|uniref:13047_t:CDS:1 n=1 Tax=Racocetra persica TaxID=160502 RepID=A0ACA9KL73_9GLOM|nr:13047_t:CDS:2 [Racocetra persica]